MYRRQWREQEEEEEEEVEGYTRVRAHGTAAFSRSLLRFRSVRLFQAQAVQEYAHVQLRTSVDKNTRRYNVSLGTRAAIVSFRL